MDVGHHDHLTMAFERASLGEPHDTTSVVDGHERAGPLDLDHVGVDPGEGAATHLALSAPTARAQQRGGEAAHQGRLAQPGAPTKR